MSTATHSLTVAQLRCYLAVLDAGSFAEAGRRLQLTTSGVSKLVSRLEAAHGVSLLHRSTHSLSPTEAGERLISPARAVLDSIAAAEGLLDDLARAPMAGRVRITAPTAFVRTCLTPLLPIFIAEHPSILLDIRASDTTSDLAESGVDLALRSGSLAGLPGHVQQPWFRFAWVACATPAYLERRGIPNAPSNLNGHDLIGFRNTRTGLVEQWRLKGVSSSAMSWRVVLDDAEAAWRAVLAGVGVAWAPHWLAAADLTSGKVAEVLGNYRGPDMQMSIVRRNGATHSGRVNTVVRFLKSQASTFKTARGC